MLESAWKAFLHRRLLSYIKHTAYSKISNSHADIWILGRPNSGKSSVLICLLDEIKTSSNPPLVSLKIETGILLLGKSYAKTARVAPGQTYVFERFRDDFRNSLSTKNPSTIIFVVDFGFNFNEIHEKPEADLDAAKIFTSLTEHREKQLKIEIESLEYFTNQIKSVPAALLSIKNVIILINKIDLFKEEDIQQALEYYTPEGASEFSKAAKSLADHINQKNTGYSVFTLCAWPKHQKFKGFEIKSTFDQVTHSASRTNFIRQLDNLLES